MLIIVMLPDAPLATGKHLQPVIYSSSWNEIIKAVEGSNGDMAVLPAGQLRVFDHAENRPVLDPAPRLVPVEVLNADDLPVQMTRTLDGQDEHNTVVVRGENLRAHHVEQALLQGAPAGVLASLGVRWVLIESVVAPEGSGHSGVSQYAAGAGAGGNGARSYPLPGAGDRQPRLLPHPLGVGLRIHLPHCVAALNAGGLHRHDLAHR
ncbi:MAG: hypothetical protein U1U88_001587 [Lawsonella clevelandensis]